MNDQACCVAKVDVGTPRSEFQRCEIEMVEVRFHEFSDMPSTRDSAVESPEFTCLGHQWRLVLWPGGSITSDDEMVDVDLNNLSEEGIEIFLSFSVRNAVGKERARMDTKHNFEPRGQEDDDYWSAVNFCKRSTLMNCLVDGALIVEVRMKKKGAAESHPSAAFIPENPIGRNILNKFMDEESADVAFAVGKEKAGVENTRKSKKARTSATVFHAHRLVLMDGAPTLAELCTPGEVNKQPVSIADVAPEVFRLVLYYVYGGEVSDEEFNANARDLIDAADRFGVVGLKLAAEARYVESTEITVENLLDNLLYADSKNCALLKEVAMDFVVENREDVLGSVSFNDIPSSMVTDLLTAVTRVMKKDDGPDNGSTLRTMRVGSLRRMLHEKGLDVDGSREAMITLLKDNP